MPLKVEVVATDSQVWSGEASQVVLRTKSGEIGLLPG
ncbi:MAG: F0F1 ATP synthase subunit epsilon, partial [Actinomycetes bacterium]